MLGSITSLGERSRGRNWTGTYLWFFVGAVLGGAVLGLTLIALRTVGQVLPQFVVFAIAVALALFVLWAALSNRTPPSLHRQVDHRWLYRYRGWVIGAGFGFQLGVGALTLIPSFALYLLGIFALLGAPTFFLGAAGILYGVLRAVSALPGRWIRSPGELQRAMAISTRLERYATPLARLVDVTASAAIALAVTTVVAF
jgi:hypothetical protein